MDVTYITSALKAEQLPALKMPEIGIVGRSNSGKSTLINTLLARKNLSRASRTPGRTQLVHFFSVAGKWVLADLPGYGFSKAAKNTAGQWTDLAYAYMQRTDIKGFMFLKDIRREWDEDDFGILRTLSRFAPVMVCLTKADKLSRSEMLQWTAKTEKLAQVAQTFPVAVIATSSIKMTGIKELRLAMEKNFLPELEPTISRLA
jgi:GTP-binding protein